MPSTEELARLLRYWSLTSTSAAGSGHPTSSLSAADLMAVLFFGGFFRFGIQHPHFAGNDRLIFSKGHASPLLYALWAAAGAFPAEKLVTLRQKGSFLQGHPGMDFPLAEVATGSLGQGLSMGIGMALAARMDGLSFRTFVLLGDGELAEGNIWEAAQIASHYKLGNLIAVADINRLEQTGETQLGHDLATYKERFTAFGWRVLLVDGHDHTAIASTYRDAAVIQDKPTIILAKTFKGRGVSFLENQEGWHGRALPKDKLDAALGELGTVDLSWRGEIQPPADRILSTPSARKIRSSSNLPEETIGEGRILSVRKAYGEALVQIAPTTPNLVVLDADLSNSTFSETFKKTYPEQYLEMFIAEQNMVATAVGLSARGKHPFVSTFGAFFSRAFDQIRMAAYSLATITFCGSHVGVSIGQDGVSQMGLEDIALFRSVMGCVVLYPSDAWSMLRMVEVAAQHKGLVYLRSTRAETSQVYDKNETFVIGGSKTVREGSDAAIVAAGITLHEAIKAAEQLAEQGIQCRIIDLYSIKPIDTASLRSAAAQTGRLIVVEDHYPEGGIGEAVRSALGDTPVKFTHLAVHGLPHSGAPEENLSAAGISAADIERAVLAAVR